VKIDFRASEAQSLKTFLTCYTIPKMRINKDIFLFFIVFSLAGCTSLVQKSGEALEGSAFAVKRTALYSSGGGKNEVKIELKEMRPKDGEDYVEITSGLWPGLALRGNIPDDDGRFELREARVLSSHVQGWNEFNLDLLGGAVFEADGGKGALRIAGEVERVQISSGRIRLKSSRLSGNAALAPLRNRRERILALTEWMQGKSGLIVFTDQKEFENFWKPRLFPELVLRKNRPQEYSGENAEWRRADSVRWNRTYTKLIFPEELRELKNSGALLRDWEEALPWIYIEYSWNTIIDSFNETILLKTRR
jgi:hypothetical protein